jgi:hypothetical protein
MKRFLKITFILILSIGLIIILRSCVESVHLPEVTTANVYEITQTSAISGGNVIDKGGYEVTARGVCWDTTENPTINSSKTSDGAGEGAFTSTITGLTTNTNYYVRAYATNQVGTRYGNEIGFTTKP